MSPDLSHRHEEDEFGEEVPRRSIFAQGWFRVVLVLIALLVVAIVALPYVLDWWAPPPPPVPLVKAPIPPPPPPLPTPKVEPPKSAPSPPAAKPEPAPPKAAPAPAQTEARATPKPEPTTIPPSRGRRTRAAPAGGEYWIQVGAFKEEANAASLAARLAAEKYPAKHLALARPVGGTHEVYVVGASASDVNGKLPSKDYRAEAVSGETVIRPALPLRDAVALSKDLATQGLTVKIRRAQGGETYHVVRVGGYPDRQHARTVQKELADKGIEGFVVKGEKR